MMERFAARVDAFGKVSIDGSTYGDFRIIDVAAHTLALFHASKPPELIEFTGSLKAHGRKITLPLADGREMLFVRAGCGCQTPQELRGPRRNFLSLLEPADADA